MNNLPETILYRTAALIFEELGFLMPRPDSPGDSGDDCQTAVVLFHGPFSGCLKVILNAQLLKALSSNMLGNEDVAGEGFEEDSLREVANVICGNALPAIFGSDPVFNLDAPQLVDSGSFKPQSNFTTIATAKIGFDYGTADVTLYAEKR